MNFNTFFERLNEASESGVENAYSHIVYDIIHIALDSQYCLIDTSPWNKGADEKIVPKDVMAVPDFVITDKNYKFKDSVSTAYGCVEVKYIDKHVHDAKRVVKNDKTSYLNKYNKVLYTNGWIWLYFNGSETPAWTINFRENPTNVEFGKLLFNLCSIDWKKCEV